jgi:IPT/TIG domain
VVEPTILSASPAPTSGGLITILGTNFGNSSDFVSVYIASIGACQDVNISDTTSSLSCIAPPGVGAHFHIFLYLSLCLCFCLYFDLIKNGRWN